jgi:hypothetical protein
LTSQNLNKIASNWIAYTIRCNPQTGDLKDAAPLDRDAFNGAVIELGNILMEDLDASLQIVESILKQSSDPWVLENLGAGPLEDLLSKGDPAVIDFIETKHRSYPNLVDAMRYMWTDSFPPRSKAFVEKILTQN